MLKVKYILFGITMYPLFLCLLYISKAGDLCYELAEKLFSKQQELFQKLSNQKNNGD